MKKNLFKILLVVLMFELFIFNFNSYKVLTNREKIEFLSQDFDYIETDEVATIVEVKNINLKIKTIHLEIKNVQDVDYEFMYIDQTTEDFFGTPIKTYIDTLENSKYISCNLSGNSQSFRIKIYAENVEVESITINEKIPFNFNYARVLILYFVILSIYLIKTNEIFQIPFSEKNFYQELVLLIILAVFLCIVCYINDFSKQEGIYDFYCLDFVNAICNGKISLLEEPIKELTELENPYDFSARINAGIIKDIDYKWDVALYNGKYYVYFGILPVLLIFIPYYIITKKYMLCATAVLIFSILAAISMKMLIKNIFNRFFKDVHFKFMVYSLLILLFGSQILILNGIPRFYEVPISAGIFFAIAGLNFMFLATEKEKINYAYMFWSCLCLSLSVACRPTQIFSSLIILPIIVKIFINNIKKRKDIVKNILAVGIPYLTVGILLMWYNYVRFDSIFEFGASYQLTINDMSNLRSRFMTIGVGIVCNLLSIPFIVPSFPFVCNHNNLLTFYGYYYIENMIGGLFILVPICFSIFSIYKILKKSKNKDLSQFVVILIVVGIVFCIISSMMGGSIQRYISDYAWILIIAGICSFIEMYNMYNSEETKGMLKRIFGILTIYIIIINFCAGVISEKSFMRYNSPEEYYKLKYSIDFWE